MASGSETTRAAARHPAAPAYAEPAPLQAGPCNGRMGANRTMLRRVALADLGVRHSALRSRSYRAAAYFAVSIHRARQRRARLCGGSTVGSCGDQILGDDLDRHRFRPREVFLEKGRTGSQMVHDHDRRPEIARQSFEQPRGRIKATRRSPTHRIGIQQFFIERMPTRGNSPRQALLRKNSQPALNDFGYFRADGQICRATLSAG